MISPFEAAILGLLRSKERSSYELTKLFSQGQFFWSGSPGAVYPAVKRLENLSFIEANNLGRAKIYGTTERGLAALQEFASIPIRAQDLSANLAMIRLTLRLSIFLDTEKRLDLYYQQQREIDHAIFTIESRLLKMSGDRIASGLAKVTVSQLTIYREFLDTLIAELQQE